MTTRILLADDHEDIRTAYRIILDAQPDMQVVADAPDGLTALRLARRIRPDVVLADIRMPHLDGLDLTRQLAGPDVADPLRVVVVTTFDLDEYVHTALANGAAGFLLKRSSPALLTEAIRAAMAGDTLISPQLTLRLLRHYAPPEPSQQAPREALSPRERQIATLVADGATNAEIAAELFLSPGTVKNHLAHIQRKLGTRNRVGIATWSLTHRQRLP
ncbi:MULTISPECIES: response regulator [Kitasatospora]|uniref:LuxR family transcriptional regulator n=1 Tax=Kitasatospora griseola TaxID=2064 RepID=A0A0D0NEP1_KITGR|nr:MULTISPECIES: response regulator transcription factor [Kitasatospora]KIQ66705.1 LuxR family transcriptional regulator [Kitasatospora griseola]PJN28011.1 DNA-binding response regulator [Kitasatospora sp. CB02891]GGQ65328.1 DNA-binding response regulator [Kitasatospora griseola]